MERRKLLRLVGARAGRPVRQAHSSLKVAVGDDLSRGERDQSNGHQHEAQHGMLEHGGLNEESAKAPPPHEEEKKKKKKLLCSATATKTSKNNNNKYLIVIL